jgi:hypothetical protein
MIMTIIAFIVPTVGATVCGTVYMHGVYSDGSVITTSTIKSIEKKSDKVYLCTTNSDNKYLVIVTK